MRQDILGKSKYNVSLCIDVAFCCILLPLQMYAFPVERWWGTYPLFFCSFMVWLYATFFLYKYYIVPRLFANGKKRTMALVVMLLSIVVTYILSMYKISSPLFNVHQEYRRNHPYPVWGMRLNEQAVWIHYILVVFFCFTVGLLKEMYRQKLARTEVEYQRNKAELS